MCAQPTVPRVRWDPSAEMEERGGGFAPLVLDHLGAVTLELCIDFWSIL